MTSFLRTPHWQCARQRFDLGTKAPLIMGILNVTPDSFSDGGAHNRFEDALSWAESMRPFIEIVDVGGESTRPGFDETGVTLEMERARVMPVVAELARRGFCVSVDTSKPEIMRESALAGASILNDIRGFERPGALEAAARTSCGLVVMHRAQLDPVEEPVGSVYHYLEARTEAFLALGVDPGRICWDPGVGFGKSYEQNMRLLAASDVFVRSGFPLMTAVSRKSVVGIATGVEKPSDRVSGSVAGALLSAQAGAHVLRVHDVRATREAVAMLRAWRAARMKNKEEEKNGSPLLWN